MKTVFLLLLIVPVISSAQQKKLISGEPVIIYAITINDTNFNSYNVEMNIHNVTDTFEVAMVKHFEYDDRFWRFVKNFSVHNKNGEGMIIREDSALWKIITTGNEAILHYQIQPPFTNEEHGSWKPFVASNGALIGGPQSFMYIVGCTKTSSVIALKLPAEWTIATGFTTTENTNTFYASSVYNLIDEPILAGKLKIWNFILDSIPHRIAYYPLPDAKSFDTNALIKDIKNVAGQAKKLFGSFPYHNYTFQLIDGTYGGLEHRNSVTLAANSAELVKGDTDFLSEMAHEYFHAWNLVRIRPAEYGDVTYKENPLAKELWWSEGMTMFYADLLLRRAALPVYETNRIVHLEQLMSRYFSETGNTKISPEKVSLAANGEPDMLGDYSASPHLQGELLGAMLDFIIRNATKNKNNIDDVMSEMMKQFGDKKGFTNSDIEKTITEVCDCNVHTFFKQYIYGNNTIDFNKYLHLAGLHSNISWANATNDDGKPAPDFRVYAWLNAKNKMLLGITDPESIWGKAGLHTGDEIITINNSSINTQRDFFNIIGKAKIGDTITIKVKHAAGIYKARVIVSTYKIATVKIEELSTATKQQRKLRWLWLAGN